MNPGEVGMEDGKKECEGNRKKSDQDQWELENTAGQVRVHLHVSPWLALLSSSLPIILTLKNT